MTFVGYDTTPPLYDLLSTQEALYGNGYVEVVELEQPTVSITDAVEQIVREDTGNTSQPIPELIIVDGRATTAKLAAWKAVRDAWISGGRRVTAEVLMLEEQAKATP